MLQLIRFCVGFVKDLWFLFDKHFAINIFFCNGFVFVLLLYPHLYSVLFFKSFLYDKESFTLESKTLLEWTLQTGGVQAMPAGKYNEYGQSSVWSGLVDGQFSPPNESTGGEYKCTIRAGQMEWSITVCDYMGVFSEGVDCRIQGK